MMKVPSQSVFYRLLMNMLPLYDPNLEGILKDLAPEDTVRIMKSLGKENPLKAQDTLIM